MFHLLRWFSSPSTRQRSSARVVRLEVEQFEELRLPAPLALATVHDRAGQAHHGQVRPEKRLVVADGQLTNLWETARRGGRYAQPTGTELRQAELLFRRTLLGQESLAGLRRAWLRLHFDLLRVSSGGETLLVVRESAGFKTGRGFYVFRQGNVPAIALQAPHGTDDANTGTIALNLFQEGPIQAGALNTVGRSSGGKKNSTDMAHLQSSYFQAFTRAFALANPRGVIVQLHGFEGDNRTTEAGVNADMILSSGNSTPTPFVVQTARLLKRNLFAGVKLFPTDVNELGGTTNAQSRLLQGLGHDGFMHVEMRPEVREMLRDQASLRAIFLQNLLAAFNERQR